jgi:hypothetical protein
LSLLELIAQTPGAQPRKQLLERIKARRQNHTKKLQEASSSEQFSTPEPLPLIDDPEYLAGFVKRLQVREKEKQKPPKRSKPRLLINNDKPNPPDKK